MSDQTAFVPGVVYEATRLEVSDLELDEWKRLAVTLGQMERSRQWWIGDLLLYGERAFSEDDYYQAAESFGLAPKTLLNYRSICSRFEPSRRRETVSWSIHAELASLDGADQTFWLDAVERESLTVVELRERLRGDVVAGERLPGVEAGEDSTVVQRRLERLSLAAANGIVISCPDGEFTIEDLLWLLELAKRLTRSSP